MSSLTPDDPLDTPDCTCDRPVAAGGARVRVEGITRARVTLEALGADCDRDGDLFPSCTRGEADTGCCAALGAGVAEQVDDCHDEVRATCLEPGCDTRQANPFKSPELRADEVTDGLPLARHQRWCDDGLDNDCRAEADVSCAGLDADGDGVGADRDCDDRDPDRFPGNVEQCADGVDQDRRCPR